MRRILALRQLGPSSAWVLSLAWLGLVTALDIATGDSLALTLFYLPSVGMAAWVLGPRGGFFTSVAAAGANLAATQVVSGGPSLAIDIANTGFRFVFFAGFAYLTTLLRRLIEAIEQNAAHDELTGIANRRAFYAQVGVDRQRAERSGEPISLIYVDLDDLKRVNDQLGHEKGDRLLQLFTERVSAELRPTDWFARMGGDEFAVALVDTGADAAQQVARRLQEVLDHPDPSGLTPRGSIGCATFVAVPSTVEEMVHVADGLMYEAKKVARGSVRFACVDGGQS